MEKAPSLLGIINSYLKTHRELREQRRALCKALVSILRRHIPDIECRGDDIICLVSPSRTTSSWYEKFKAPPIHSGGVSLEKIIVSLIPELKGHIEAPFGLYVTREEAEQIKKQILQTIGKK